MKKVLRWLGSGHIFLILALLVEVGLLLFFELFGSVLSDIILDIFQITDNDIANLVSVIVLLFYGFVRFVIFLVALLIFFKIINRAEDPEFKIPWIVGMLIFPFFCSVLFLIFGKHELSKKDKIIIKATKNAYNAHFDVDAQKEDMGRAYGAFKYLNSTTKLGAHDHCRVTYYPTGEEFFPAFIEGLKQAKEFIFIEFFIISDGKEWNAVQEVLKQKAAEGVDVRIVYDDMGCAGTISFATPRKLKKFGIKCYKFHKFKFLLSGKYNNRDHRKIVIIDHQMAFTGGINLADEYANEIKRFGYWKDTMIKIEGSAINNLITIFLQNHDLCTEEVSDYNKYLLYKYPEFADEGFVMPFGDGPGGIDDALIGEQNYVNILNYATKSCYISTPYLIPTYQLTDAMRNAALRGVDVHLIVPGIPDKKAVYSVAKSNFRYLLDAGVKIHIYKPGFNHMKSAIADDELAFVGTINFDFRSLVHHFECGALLYKVNCMKDIKADFDQMVSVSEQVPANYVAKLGTRWFCSLIKIITPLL